MLELINVKKVYKTSAGDVAALDGVSIRFPEKGMVFVTGKSGSGKTTLLNVVGGLDGIDSGEIEVYGKKFSEFTADEYDSYRNTLIGFIFQEYNLLPDYNIEKNVGIANELQGVESDSEAVKNVLHSVDIDSYEGRNPSQLSGGQKQRVAIARALIKNPKIIMADEPTGALDSVTGIQVVEELKRLSKEKLVIVISHDLELANKYADRIIRLVDGKVVEDFSVEEVEVQGSVFEDNKTITVKMGSDLNEGETKVLLDAIKQKKPVKFTNSVTAKKKIPTDESKIKNSGEKVELIKSKMKFASAAMLGIKSLKVKPLRLIFTILLSAVAFAVFGVFDTIASYDRSAVIADLLKRGEYSSIALSGEYASGSGNTRAVNLDDNTIAELNAGTGFDFKPVYSAKLFVSKDFSVPGKSTYGISNTDNKNFTIKAKGKKYYYPQVNGIIEFGQDEVNAFGEIEKYGYYPVGASRFPEYNVNDTYVEVAISEYLAESLLYHLGANSPFFGNDKRINVIEDLLGVQFKISGANMDQQAPVLRIVGIYNCGDIPAEYDFLKDAYYSEKNDPNKPQADALYAYLSSGAHNLIMVAQGEAQRAIDRFNKPIPFYDEPANYSIDDTIDDKYIVYSKYVRDYFFTQETIPGDKVVMFDSLTKAYDETAPKTYELKENEILIHASDLRNLFQLELTDKDTKSGTLRDYLGKVREFGSYDDRDQRKELSSAMTICFNLANELLYKSYPQLFNGKDMFRNITLIRNLSANNVENRVELKVVGVYYGMQNMSVAEGSYSPFVSNTKTLENIGVYTGQGNYAYAIGLKANANTSSSKFIASKLTASSGLYFNWYGNTTLDTLSKNEQMILQFTDLFLYAALVLALFSIFMLFNYISTSIVSKRQSIGILRALGSNSGDVFKMFITESVIISVINGILASIIAFVACVFVNSYIRDFMQLGINFALYGFRQVIVIFAISIVTGIASSIIPIIKIAREKPVDLIRRP